MKAEDFKWIEGFGTNGLLNKKVFAATFNMYPNTHVRYFKHHVILNEQVLEAVKKLYPTAVITTRTDSRESANSCVNYSLSRPFLNNEKSIDIWDDKLYISISDDCLYIDYIDQNIQEHIDKILEILPRDNKAAAASVKLVAYSSGFYTIDSKIEPTEINLSENYNDDFIPEYDNIIKFLDERKSGLIILRGTKGSGKTNLLRHLMTTHPDNYIIITNATASYLAAPEFMSFMMDHQNAIFILEDCEQILMDRGESFSNAIATILNMSDGLLSDIFNVKFICTFNADIDKIDEAILRKGRCFVNYEFTKLSADKTKVLLNKQGIELDKYEPMTLADIYNYEIPKCTKEEKKKIGF